MLSVCRYGADGLNAYKRNIEEMFKTFRRVLQPDTLFIWTTALPVSQAVRGGVILDTIRFLSDVLRFDILIANDFCSQVVVLYSNWNTSNWNTYFKIHLIYFVFCLLTKSNLYFVIEIHFACILCIWNTFSCKILKPLEMIARLPVVCVNRYTKLTFLFWLV